MSLLETLEDRAAAASAAILVVDMQNDFCAEGGYISKLGRDTSACRRIVPALSGLVAAARGAGMPVIWLQARYDAGDVPEPMRLRQAQMGGGMTCCAEGSWGAEPFGLEPEAEDVVVIKHTFSGFVGTPLDEILRERGVRSIVLAGVQTNVCVESTLRDAHAHGYYVIVPRDAVASHMPDEHSATLRNVAFLFGDVVETDDLVRLWGGQSAAA